MRDYNKHGKGAFGVGSAAVINVIVYEEYTYC